MALHFRLPGYLYRVKRVQLASKLSKMGLNEPHELDKHEPVPKENRHEEIGERAMAALNSTTGKSVTRDSGCRFVCLLFKHLWAVVAVEFQQMDAKPTEHTVVECNGLKSPTLNST